MSLIEKNYPAMLNVVTEVSKPELVSDLIHRGVTDVILKPFGFGVFAAKVRALLEIRGSETSIAPSGQVDSVTDKIESTSAALKEQLEGVTAAFKSTIDELEQRKNQIESGYADSIRTLIQLFDGRNSAVTSHAGRVERLATPIGEPAGLSHGELFVLRTSSLLRGVGLIGMPDAVRRVPPSSLSGQDKVVYQRYPLISAVIVGGIEGAEDSTRMIEPHMENFDGSGFPTGVSGDDISVGARILRLVDGTDTFAMQEHVQTNSEVVVTHIRRETGRSYDPKLADIAVAQLSKLSPEYAFTEVRQVKRDSIDADMRLAENVYNAQGQLLVRRRALRRNWRVDCDRFCRPARA